LVFDVTSGANSYAGDPSVVVDNGGFDCNGDGVNDPNIITGPGAARHGPMLGSALSEVARTVHGIRLQEVGVGRRSMRFRSLLLLALGGSYALGGENPAAPAGPS